jgi:CheY-like chemotaxis protein
VLDFLGRTLGGEIEVQMSLADELWPVLADETQVESALINLAINARDAMPNGGCLTVETANVRLDEAYASGEVDVTPGDYVVLAVSDTGTGIAPDVLARVFDPFFTTKEPGKGSGLGLSMVYGFAKQSGGHVKIYSEVGHGTTVRLFLPRAAVAAAKDARPARDDLEVAGRAATILVVEDDPDVRRSVVNQLARLGHRIHEAEDAAAALKFLKRGEHIDLLFTDIIMPGGMSGIDLAAEARKRRPDLKVLFTTGFAEAFSRNVAHVGPNGRLLTKPYGLRDLDKKIRETLQSEGRKH